MENVLYESYGPGGTAIIIEGLTDNRNRAAAEIKHILSKNGLQLATPGAASWAFEKVDGKWIPKTAVGVSDEDGEKLMKLTEELEDHDDVQGVYTNV
jgi:transcriptional/translational regulatory protein YebC/TACO1